MGFNQNSLPTQVLDKVVMGLEGKDGAAVDQIGTKIPVTSLSGTVPTVPSLSTLANLDGRGAIAEGAVSREFDMAFGNASYACGRYVGKSYVPYGVEVEINGLGVRTLEMYAKQARRISAALINADLNTALSSTSLNTEEVAGTAWTSSSSTPVDDMQDAMAKCGYGDAGFFGRDVVEALQQHPDFTARLSNYSGGALSEGEVLDVIRRLFPSLRKIVLGTNMYNSANEGQSATLAFQFDGLAWFGHESALLVPEQPGNNSATWQDEDREAHGIRFTRRLDILRVHQDMGSVITGVI